jgi:hypothetical protein
VLKSLVNLTADDFLRDPVKTHRSDWETYASVDSTKYKETPAIEKAFLTSAMVLHSCVVSYCDRKYTPEISKSTNITNIVYGVKIGDTSCQI